MTTDTAKLLRYAGFLTWGLTGLPLLVELAQQPALWHAPPYILWLICFALFGAAFGLTGWRSPAGRAGPGRGVSLILQAAAALTMILLGCVNKQGLQICMRANEIVPLPVKGLRRDIHGGHLLVRHLPAGRVAAPVEPTPNREALGGGGVGD